MFVIFCDIISNFISLSIFLKNVIIHSDSVKLYTMIMVLKMCNMKYMHTRIVSFKVFVFCYCLCNLGVNHVCRILDRAFSEMLISTLSNKNTSCNLYGVLVFIVF